MGVFGHDTIAICNNYHINKIYTQGALMFPVRGGQEISASIQNFTPMTNSQESQNNSLWLSNFPQYYFNYLPQFPSQYLSYSGNGGNGYAPRIQGYYQGGLPGYTVINLHLVTDYREYKRVGSLDWMISYQPDNKGYKIAWGGTINGENAYAAQKTGGANVFHDFYEAHGGTPNPEDTSGWNHPGYGLKLVMCGTPWTVEKSFQSGDKDKVGTALSSDTGNYPAGGGSVSFARGTGKGASGFIYFTWSNIGDIAAKYFWDQTDSTRGYLIGVMDFMRFNYRDQLEYDKTRSISYLTGGNDIITTR